MRVSVYIYIYVCMCVCVCVCVCIYIYMLISVARKCVISNFLRLLFQECFILEEQGGLVGRSDGQKDSIIYSKLC
jgi:hypothetical protein